jgi:nicotinamidase-related amidase
MTGSRVSSEEKSSSVITGRCPLCAPRRNASTVPSQSGADDIVGHALLVLRTEQGASSAAGPPKQALEAIDGVVLTAIGFGIAVIDAQQLKKGIATGVLRPKAKANATSGLAHGAPRDLISDFYFTTSGCDAFSDDRLSDALQKHNVGHLFLAGADGMTAIKPTAQSALDRGYRVTFIQDAIFASSVRRWQRSLRDFESEGAFAITSQDFTALAAGIHKAREARHPEAAAQQASLRVAAVGQRRMDRLDDEVQRSLAPNVPMGRIPAAHVGIRSKRWRSEVAWISALALLGAVAAWQYHSEFASDVVVAVSAPARTAALAPYELPMQVAQSPGAKADDAETPRPVKLTMSAETTRAEEAERAEAAARHALQQQRKRADELAHDLAELRDRLEKQVAMAARSGDEATRFQQATEQTIADLHQALQQERDKAERLARDLNAAQRELELRARTPKTEHATLLTKDQALPVQESAPEQRTAETNQQEKVVGRAQTVSAAPSDMPELANGSANDRLASAVLTSGVSAGSGAGSAGVGGPGSAGSSGSGGETASAASTPGAGAAETAPDAIGKSNLPGGALASRIAPGTIGASSANGGNGAATGTAAATDWAAGKYYGAGSPQERARAYSLRAISFRRGLFKNTSDCLTAAYTQRLPLDLCR